MLSYILEPYKKHWFIKAMSHNKNKIQIFSDFLNFFIIMSTICKSFNFFNMIRLGYGEELIDHIEDETISAFQRMMMRLASVSEKNIYINDIIWTLV